jgi:hypothetical protein
MFLLSLDGFYFLEDLEMDCFFLRRSFAWRLCLYSTWLDSLDWEKNRYSYEAYCYDFLSMLLSGYRSILLWT